MRRSMIVLGALVAWSVMLPAQQSQSPGADPILGTWRLNVAKSTYSPGPPPPATAIQIRHYAPGEGGSINYVLIVTDPQGVPNFQASVFKIDGKQYPVYTAATTHALLTSGKTTDVMRAYRRIDRDSTEYVTYTNGVASPASVRVVAKDGKSFTDTTKGRNPQGREVHNVLIFERVR